MKIFTRSVLLLSLLSLTFGLKAGGGMLYSPADVQNVFLGAPQNNSNAVDPNATPASHTGMRTVYVGSPDGQPASGVNYFLSPGNATNFMIPVETEGNHNPILNPMNEDVVMDAIQMRGNIEHIQVRGSRSVANVVQVRGNRANPELIQSRGNRANPEAIQVRGSRGDNPQLLNPVSDVELIQVQEVEAEPLQMRGAINSGTRNILADLILAGEAQQVQQESAPEKTAGAAAEAMNSAEMQVWPNPSQGMVNFKATIPGESTAQLQVISAEGKIVRQFTLEGMDDQFKDQLFLDGLPGGLYHIRITTADQVLDKQLVLQR